MFKATVALVIDAESARELEILIDWVSQQLGIDDLQYTLHPENPEGVSESYL